MQGDLEDIQSETNKFQIKIVYTSALPIIYLHQESESKLHLFTQRMG